MAYRKDVDNDTVRIVVKGAPEYIIPMCNYQITGDGNVENLDEREQRRILEVETI